MPPELLAFEDAKTAFEDPLSLTGADPDCSEGELRWITMGMSSRGQLLLISHTDDGETIRIISARQATRRERRLYEEG